jgi:hypothetical protein
MRSRVNEGGKPEASYQPVEVNDETAVGIWNGTGRMQWQNSNGTTGSMQAV